MSEVLKNKGNSDSQEWGSLSEVPSSEKKEYTNEERKQIARYERMLVEDQEDYERAQKRLEKFERGEGDCYDQAEAFYMMDRWRSEVESDKLALKNLKEHKPPFEEKAEPEEKDYIPEKALEVLDSIPDSANFLELKKRVKNAYYSVNVGFGEAAEKLSEVMERRKEYLNGNEYIINDSREKDFWFMKKLELNRTKEFNEKQANSFLRKAKEFAGCEEEPEKLSYVLYQDDDWWKLEYYH